MKPTESQFLRRVIKAYLSHKPFFYIFIRPQEALLFHRHRQLLKPPILDFGCGDGFFAQLAYGRTIDIGLDLPKTGISSPLASTVYKSRLTYDGEDIPLKANSVQTIVSNCVFEHISNLKLSLSEMYRVLKPGGNLLTTVMTKVWEEQLIGRKIFGQYYADWLKRKQIHQQLPSHRQWQQQFVSVGFVAVDSVGYLHPPMAQKNELFHYLAFPQIIFNQVLGTWNPLGPLPNLIFNNQNLLQAVLKDTETNSTSTAAAIYILQKPISQYPHN